jgi:hypothetical protein
MATSSNNRSRHLLWLLLPLVAFRVQADDEAPVRKVVYDRQLGELSVGTQAPTPQDMVNVIRSASVGRLTAFLEYGERVECMQCIPLLEQKLLDSGDARVREMSAWWLRRRPFGYGRIALAMRSVAVDDQDPVRRSRAAEALGEFLDVGGLAALEHAATLDDSAQVRLSAVRALGRLNAVGGHPALSAAMQDDDPKVRRAALDQVKHLRFWTDDASISSAVADPDARVRLRAVQLAGERGVDEAVAGLTAVLSGDDEVHVRQAAAWALGRIGGGEASAALRAAEADEQSEQVRDAIAIALQM